MSCPSCQAAVAIPKLGELRRLPLAEPQAEAQAPRHAAGEPSRLAQAGFVLAGLIATASLLIAGFCGIRWALTDVPRTTEDHVATMRDQLSQFTAAELIREYEDLEKASLELSLPYPYKESEIRRSRWGRNASISGAIGVAAILMAAFFAVSGRRKPG